MRKFLYWSGWPFVLLPLFSLLYILIFWQRLLLDGMVPLNSDALTFHYPSWVIGKNLLKEGFFFLWDPYRNMGQPFLAAPQNQAIYPFRLLSFFLNYVDYQRINIVFHTLLCSAFAYFLAQEWFKDKTAALLAAVGLGFNGFVFARAGYPADFMTMAWMPGIIYFLCKGRPVLLGVSLSMAWLAGFPPFFLLILLFAFVFCTISNFPKYFPCLAKGAVIGAGLSAIQAIPFLELLIESQRGVFIKKGELLANSLNPFFAWKHLIYPSFLLRSFDWFDFSMIRFYHGPVLLALFLMAFWRGDKFAKKLGGMALLALLLSFGSWTGFYKFIPLVNIFQFPARWLIIYMFCLVMVAAQSLSLFKSKGVKQGFLLVVALDLLVFSTPLYGLWADQKFLTSIYETLPGLKDFNPQFRIFHSNNIIGAEKWRWTDDKTWFFSKGILLPSYGTAFKLREASSHFGLTSKRTASYIARLNHSAPSSPLFDYAGVSGIVALTKEGMAKSIPTWADVGAYINPDPKPRAFMENNLTPVRIQMEKPGLIQLEAAGPGRLVFSESYFPGWKATIDGKPSEIKLFEEQFSSCELAPGNHSVRFEYGPRSFLFGAFLSLFTALILLIGAGKRFWILLTGHF